MKMSKAGLVLSGEQPVSLVCTFGGCRGKQRTPVLCDAVCSERGR